MLSGTILFYISIYVLFSQNLIENGDFESYFDLPTNVKQWYKCVGWSNVNGNTDPGALVGSPDYFHLDGTGNGSLPEPGFNWSIVYPQSGAALMGFGHGRQNLFFGSEYISTQLTSPLIIDETYLVTFWITNGNADTLLIGSNGLGIRFSKEQLQQEFVETIQVIPHFELDEVFWDSTWVKYTFQFTADSNYQFITFGNFKKVNELDFIVPSGHSEDGFSYFFIDNISMVSSNILNNNNNTLTNPTFYPNPHKNYLNIDFGEYVNFLKIEIYNSRGKFISSDIAENVKSLNLEIDGPDGTYFLKIYRDLQKSKTYSIIKKN